MPKAGQSCGFLIPRRISPLMHISGSSVAISATSKSFSASCSANSSRRLIAALRNGSDAAPLAVADLEDLVDQLLCRQIARRG